MIAAVGTEGVSALVAGSAVVSAEDALVVVLAELRCGVEGVAGAAGQETRARVTADGVVASLRRQAVVLCGSLFFLFFFFLFFFFYQANSGRP